LKEGDFFIANIDAQDVVDALDKGEIDAGHTYGPGKSKAREKGYVYLAFSGDVEGIITDILAFHKKTIRTRPDDIKAIVKSLFEAKRFQETNREEALGIISKAIKDSPESVGAGIGAVRHLDKEENDYAMYEEISEEGEEQYSLIESGNIIADFYLKRGQLSTLPRFDEIIEPRFVKELMREQSEDK
jgi:NitT/TauT family transport system substrate-binding protein